MQNVGKYLMLNLVHRWGLIFATELLSMVQGGKQKEQITRHSFMFEGCLLHEAYATS